MKNMSILVDSREPVAIFDNLIKFIPDTKRVTLPAGDYRFDTQSGLVLIERKEVSDLISSITSGHLSEQIREIAKVAKIAIILIEGSMTCTTDGNIRTTNRIWKQGWNSVWNYLMGCQMHGFVLDFSPNQLFTIRRIVSLYDYFNKDKHESLTAVTAPPGISRQVRVLSCFPGISGIRAQRLIEYFGSLRRVFNAKWQDRVEVERVGQSASKNIDELLDEELGRRARHYEEK